MTWLAGQLWPLLLVSFLLGAATVLLWGQRRETVEVWEDVPVAPPAPQAGPAQQGDGAADAAPGDPGPSPASVTSPAPVDADDPDSPFPVAATDGPSPWEQEELWSRPARVAAPGESRRPKDEWAEAAENWRSWADEATGRGFAGDDVVVGGTGPGGTGGQGGDVSDRDRDLFAADREVDPRPGPGGRGRAGDDAEPAEVFPPAGVFPGLPGDDDTGSDDEDVFPHARPVEAARGGDETMDPMDTPDMTDDEREAAEIRRMREQARRGDTA